ncbi:MAG: hypothetical protein JW881_08100 [Spirochaetales bacterium]|nr:hypothetical protein [Spirochaetales bacterium]
MEDIIFEYTQEYAHIENRRSAVMDYIGNLKNIEKNFAGFMTDRKTPVLAVHYYINKYSITIILLLGERSE